MTDPKPETRDRVIEDLADAIVYGRPGLGKLASALEYVREAIRRIDATREPAKTCNHDPALSDCRDPNCSGCGAPLSRPVDRAPAEPSARAREDAAEALMGEFWFIPDEHRSYTENRISDALADERQAAEERAIEAAASEFLNSIGSLDAPEEFADHLRARLAQDLGNG